MIIKSKIKFSIILFFLIFFWQAAPSHFKREQNHKQIFVVIFFLPPKKYFSPVLTCRGLFVRTAEASSPSMVRTAKFSLARNRTSCHCPSLRPEPMKNRKHWNILLSAILIICKWLVCLSQAHNVISNEAYFRNEFILV